MEILDYGVCRLSIVPVRMEPTDKAEQISQLLFGDHYEVLTQTTDRKWLRIRINFDGYEGWIDNKQHHAIAPEYFEYLNRAEFKITTDITASILYNKIQQIILIGSMIPISSSELFKMEEQFAFNGEAKNVGQKREYEFLKNIAFKYLNAPYAWGGRSPFGIDCSGFSQMVFKICGYGLARDSWQQANQGKFFNSFDEGRPGDLVFFKNPDEKITHVGILLEGDRIIHASGRVRIDHLNDEGILNLETKVYSHQFAHIRRILNS
ncbi:MAG TPA: C40 family peptidase [Chryseolinea sp.]|nr:C40 family peptidase [Chryseolinea sp.]